MSILVINSGSTSLKYKLFNDNEKEVKQGYLTEIKDIERALKNALREIGDLREIKAVGHRVVHGGDRFIMPTLVDDAVLSELEKFNDLAPLHNPYNIAGIKAARDFLPNIPQIAVFDTAFFADLPEVARTYALPVQVIQKHKIKRYGFHGISHQFVAQEAARQLNIEINKINLISCHLGGGWSIIVIKNGKPIDTSMGWTPMEGLVMMTMAGDLDPGIVVELFKKSARAEEAKPIIEGEVYKPRLQLSACDNTDVIKNVYNLLNYESGLKGLSGGSANYQDLLKEMSFGNNDAKLAFDVAIYRLAKYIGAYWSVLQGNVDAIIFTGAIGAGNPITRNAVIAKLKFLGDIPVLTIKTNEELMIAREARRVISNGLVISNKT